MTEREYQIVRAPPGPGAPVVVGESNPYGGDEYFALFPEPDNCAGDRLCRLVMGLEPETYLKHFERVNLLRGFKWSAPRARDAAAALVARFPGPRVWVLLGRKVAEAFGFHGCEPLEIHRGGRLDKTGNVAVLLPHPSGRNRAWNDPVLRLHCRDALAGQLPSIPFGELERAKERTSGAE